MKPYFLRKIKVKIIKESSAAILLSSLRVNNIQNGIQSSQNV